MRNNSFFGMFVTMLMSVVLMASSVPAVGVFANEAVSDNIATDETLASETSIIEDLSCVGTEREDAISASEASSSNTGGMRKYTISANKNTYVVRITQSVVYNGKYHVINTAKETQKQSPDLTLEVYRNGSFVKPGDYSVKYHNNLNINNYGAPRTERRGRIVILNPIIPHLNVILKNRSPYKDDREIVARKKIIFKIAPVDISTVNFTVKKVRLTDDGTMSFSPTVTIDDKKFKVTPQAYSARYSSNGKITVNGVNNFTGSVTIDLMSAKEMDYIF